MALSEIEKLERRYAENPQGLTFAPLAEVHRKNGDVARALELLGPGLTVHPDYIPASIVLGRCHLDLGELPDAEAAFNHVLSLDAENVIALKALADIAERMFRFDDAERVLNALLVVDRSNDEARDQLSRVAAARQQAQVGSSLEAAAAAEPAPSETMPAAEAVASDEARAAEPATVEGIHPATPAGLGWTTDLIGEDAQEPVALDLSGVESTEMGAADPPPEGIQLEEPVTFEDELERVEPIAGMIGREEDVRDDLEEELGQSGSMVFGDDFRVETAEDIVLESSGGSEFQVANAAEELLGQRARAPEQELSEPELSEPGLGEPELGEPEVTEAEREPVEPLTAVEAIEEDPAAEVPDHQPEPVEAEAPAAEASVAEAGVGDDPGHDEPGKFPAFTPEPPPAAWTKPSAEPEVYPEPAAHPEPAPVITESMAELLLQQGYRDEALTVFRHLERRSPGDPRLLQRIGELDAAASETSPEGAKPLSQAWSVTVTGGRPVGEFLGAILAARPPAVSAGPSVHGGVPPVSGGDAQGAPTRPAHDSLSLSSVFGEESTPTPPAVPAAGSGAPAQSGVSYDEFFGAPGAPTGARPPRGPETQGDDLDQFHAWLQNLKR
jgi:tetratricopeptide (TPR) repeat protein